MLAEEIELEGRRALESHLFPDQILPQVARLRKVYQQTIDALEQRPTRSCPAAPAARARATRISGGSKGRICGRQPASLSSLAHRLKLPTGELRQSHSNGP